MSDGAVVFLLNRCPTLRERVTESLAPLDPEVRSFSDPEQLLETLRQDPPGVLVLEWTLDDLDVIDFLIRISENTSWGSMHVFFIHGRKLS